MKWTQTLNRDSSILISFYTESQNYASRKNNHFEQNLPLKVLQEKSRRETGLS